MCVLMKAFYSLADTVLLIKSKMGIKFIFYEGDATQKSLEVPQQSMTKRAQQQKL